MFHFLLLVGSIVLFLLLFIKTYWKLQLVVNSDQIGSLSHQKFFSNSRKEYNLRVEEGMRIFSKKRIVICGMLRNVGTGISKIIKKVERLGNQFLDYAVLIVENDSKDDTREKLLEWSKNNPKVTILGCGYNADVCSIDIAKEETTEHNVTKKRIQKMAFLRNIYLDEVKKSYSDFDYMLVWDLDIIGTLYTDGVANSLSYLEGEKNIPNADVICAYGSRCFNNTCIYYDTYAHKSLNFTQSDWEKRIENVKLIGEPPEEVKSCFSGFSIYKTNSILSQDIFYDTNIDIECEHTLLHEKMRKNGSRIFMNPSMLYLVLSNEYTDQIKK